MIVIDASFMELIPMHMADALSLRLWAASFWPPMLGRFSALLTLVIGLAEGIIAAAIAGFVDDAFAGEEGSPAETGVAGIVGLVITKTMKKEAPGA
jgi:hypothetical protein